MRFEIAPDVSVILADLIEKLNLGHIKTDQVVCFRSYGSNARAYARIWSLPRIWQQALAVKPHYLIEVLAEKYDRLKTEDREKVLIHELLHVPKTFSGSLVPHLCFGKRIDMRRVKKLHEVYQKAKKEKKYSF